MLELMGKKRAPPSVSPRLSPDVDARQLVLDIREELRGLLAPSVTEPRTLVELSIEWLPRKKRKLASADSFDGRVRHVLRALGHHTYQTLLPRHVEDMMDALLASELSAQTVNHVRDAGRQLVADAARNRLWPGPNPFEDVPKRKVPPHAYDMPSRDETAMLLGAVEEEHQPLVALALYLGPRRKTIFNIQPADVSLARGTMDFRVTKTGVVILGVPVPDELTPFLREAMRRARGEWLFSRPDGRQLSSRSRLLRSVLSRAIARAGLRRGARLMRLTFRDLRGVCATLHQEAGAHPWVVSKVLGHSQSSLVIAENMTARRYSKFSDEFARRELNRLSLKP